MADAREIAADALVEIEARQEFARDVVGPMREGVADPRDRALVTEIVFGVARRRPTLEAILTPALHGPLPRLDPAVRAALLTGLYQILFLDRIPPHAAVDAAVEYAKSKTNPRFAGVVNGVLRGILRSIEGKATGPEDPRRDLPRAGLPALRFRRSVFPDPTRDLAENLASRFAAPVWLSRRWVSRWGAEDARLALAVSCERPPIVLRARPGLRAAVVLELAAAGVAARAGAEPDAVIAPEGEAAALRPVREGRAYVQDATAQRVAPLLDLRPGDRVLDLCAAPGGKTLHILDLLEGRGEVVACDVTEEKVAELGSLLRSLPEGRGSIARSVRVPPSGPLPFPPGSFHAVLVDAPCTNTGVLRRRPEVRTRLAERDVAEAARKQAELVARALPLLRPGGRLVYSTCSVEPEENEGVVEQVVRNDPRLRLEPGYSTRPEADHDGGFAAVVVAAP